MKAGLWFCFGLVLFGLFSGIFPGASVTAVTISMVTGITGVAEKWKNLLIVLIAVTAVTRAVTHIQSVVTLEAASY